MVLDELDAHRHGLGAAVRPSAREDVFEVLGDGGLGDPEAPSGLGYFTPGRTTGPPADPDTGVLMRVAEDGSVLPVATGLDRPTSLEVQGDTAYVVGLDGEVVAVDLG